MASLSNLYGRIQIFIQAMHSMLVKMKENMGLLLGSHGFFCFMDGTLLFGLNLLSDCVSRLEWLDDPQNLFHTSIPDHTRTRELSRASESTLLPAMMEPKSPFCKCSVCFIIIVYYPSTSFVFPYYVWKWAERGATV